MTASDASVAAVIDVLMAVWASGPEVGIGDIPDLAEIIGTAPAGFFAGRGTAIFLPVSIGTARDGI